MVNETVCPRLLDQIYHIHNTDRVDNLLHNVCVWGGGGELNMKRPCHGAKKRWRDVLKVDLQAIGVYDRWYELCQDRKRWFHLCLDGVEKISTSRRWNTCSANKQSELRTLSCACGRKFRRQGNLTRHQHFCVMPS